MKNGKLPAERDDHLSVPGDAGRVRNYILDAEVPELGGDDSGGTDRDDLEHPAAFPLADNCEAPSSGRSQ
jgi:hypothetical protein